MISSMSLRLALAKDTAVGYWANRLGVTMLTRTSVHWAERITAVNSWIGVSYTSSQCASGYILCRRFMISFTYSADG